VDEIRRIHGTMKKKPCEARLSFHIIPQKHDSSDQRTAKRSGTPFIFEAVETGENRSRLEM
jgi:hypothetical protein